MKRPVIFTDDRALQLVEELYFKKAEQSAAGEREGAAWGHVTAVQNRSLIRLGGHAGAPFPKGGKA